MLNPEHLLVPYQVSELFQGPWLIFAPHADDETFGMGGSLLRARDAGIDTHVVVMTDGALGGEAEDLVAIRRREVQQATQMLGVKSLQCWPEQDRGLAMSERLVGQVAGQIRQLAPASVFFPAPLELHPDHRMTALLVWQALQDLAKIHPEARETFEFGISHDWALDPYAGGIGPIFRPHELSGRFFDNIVRPVNRVWFANDACDRRHRRWIEGALLSAVKNAYAIHNGMRNEIPADGHIDAAF